MSATYIPVIMDLVDKIISEDRKDGQLLRRARELLENDKGEGVAGPQGGAEPLKLRRVCWCWVQPESSPP
jgi:hypothetical protein